MLTVTAVAEPVELTIYECEEEKGQHGVQLAEVFLHPHPLEER